MSDDFQAPAEGGSPDGPFWNEDQIARACRNADIPDSRFESLLMALDDLDQFAAPPAASKAQPKGTHSAEAERLAKLASQLELTAQDQLRVAVLLRQLTSAPAPAVKAELMTPAQLMNAVIKHGGYWPTGMNVNDLKHVLSALGRMRSAEVNVSVQGTIN